MRVFFDANCLMEVLYAREKAEIVLNRLGNQGNKIQSCISTLTIHLLYYFAEKDAIPFRIVERLIEEHEILAMDAGTIEKAQEKFKGKDFEDCLQTACAESGNCDEIITLDKKFKRYSGTKLKVTVL